MFIRLLVVLICSIIIVVQSVVTNSSKGQKADDLTLSKQNTLYDDYDLNDPKSLGTNGEGSGGSASLDEYADDEEEEEDLAKVTATTTTNRPTTTTKMTTTTTTTVATTTTTTRRTTRTTTTTTTTTITTSTSRWSKSPFNYESFKRKNQNTTTLSPAFSDVDASEFKDDNDEYADDLEDDAYYNEPTVVSEKQPPSTMKTSSTVRYPSLTTRQVVPVNHTTPIWMLFTFLTRPPIAAGILAGLAIGIFTSLILLICIIQRYNKREKSHSSYTTGLLYPNQYGYSKSPQEFYA